MEDVNNNRVVLRDERAVERLADVTKLSLGADEQREIFEDLRSLMEYIDTIEDIDTDSVPPTTHITFGPAPMREDESSAPSDNERMLSNSACRDGAFIVVPRTEPGEGAV